MDILDTYIPSAGDLQDLSEFADLFRAAHDAPTVVRFGAHGQAIAAGTVVMTPEELRLVALSAREFAATLESMASAAVHADGCRIVPEREC